VAKNRQTDRPVRNAIAQVPETERREAINEHGQSRMVIMNTSSTGHNNDCFAVPTPTGGYTGRTSNMQDISDIANLVKQRNGVSRVTCEIVPEINDMYEFRRTERVTERITAANGRVRPSRAAISGPTAQDHTPHNSMQHGET
jgi:hypothetical protein